MSEVASLRNDSINRYGARETRKTQFGSIRKASVEARGSGTREKNASKQNDRLFSNGEW